MCGNSLFVVDSWVKAWGFSLNKLSELINVKVIQGIFHFIYYLLHLYLASELFS